MVRKMFILVAVIFLPQVTYTTSGSGMDTSNPSHEQVIQHLCKDCGFKSLGTVCKLLGVETTLDKVSDSIESTGDITMYELYKIATKEGLNAQWVGISIDELSNINTPAIVCTTDKHFVVVDSVVGDEVQIINHEVRYSISIEEFRKMWDRCVLILSKPDKAMQ